MINNPESTDAEGTARVPDAIDDNGGDAVVGKSFGMSARGINKWRNQNRVPPERVPEFIQLFGNKYLPHELNPDTHPLWLYRNTDHVEPMDELNA